MIFDIFNSHMEQVSWVDAVDAADALKYAKRTYHAPAVEDRRARQEQHYQSQIGLRKTLQQH